MYLKTAASILGCAMLLATTPAEAQTAPTCAQIDAATSANEEFVEIALTKDINATRTALAAIRRTYAQVKLTLPAETVTQIDELIRTIISETATRDFPSAAEAATQVYRNLIVAFRLRLPTTLNVAMLDFTGFRLLALAAMQPVPWPATEATIRISGVNTASIQKRLEVLQEPGLSKLAGNIQTGLEGAAAARQTAWLASVAQIQLDSVDLLERLIKNPSSVACP